MDSLLTTVFIGTFWNCGNQGVASRVDEYTYVCIKSSCINFIFLNGIEMIICKTQLNMVFTHMSVTLYLFGLINVVLQKKVTSCAGFAIVAEEIHVHVQLPEEFHVT